MSSSKFILATFYEIQVFYNSVVNRSCHVVGEIIRYVIYSCHVVGEIIRYVIYSCHVVGEIIRYVIYRV